MKETTVVLNREKAGTPFDPEIIEKKIGKEASDCLGNVLLGEGPDYLVTRHEDGRLAAVFYDLSADSIPWTAKLTITAMSPGARLEIRYWNQVAGVLRRADSKDTYRLANRAGVFETKLPLAGEDLLIISEES